MAGNVFRTTKELWLPAALFVLFGAPNDLSSYQEFVTLLDEHLGLKISADFGVIPRLICLALWHYVGQALFALIERQRPSLRSICERLAQEVIARYRRLNNLYHEHFAFRDFANINWRKCVLDEIRGGISETFGKARVDAVFMRAIAGADGTKRLYIEEFSTAFGHTPQMVRQGEGFPIGVGFPGKAFKSGKIHSGSRSYLFGLIPDPRFGDSPGNNGDARSFLAIPIFAQAKLADTTEGEVIGVLSISASRHGLFPLSPRKAAQIVLALEPLIEQFNHYEHLRKTLSMEPEQLSLEYSRQNLPNIPKLD